MNTQSKHSRGFTVVELVMAMAVGLVLLAAISTAVVSGQRSSTGIERKVTTNQDARAALEIMASEIRMASFNSLFTVNLWRNPTNCNVSGNQNYKGIQEATATAITIEMDIGSPTPSGVCGDTAGEIIRYEYEAANLRLTRESITCTPGRSAADAQSFLGPITGQPEVRTVEVANGAVPVFRYFDGTGAEILNPSADIPRIRRIEIALLVRSADVDPNTGQKRQMAYSTSVITRNHGITGL
jgi:prepilin-type N-terminal cleavage/methylation domain-containing protein